jgi:hypothetical protein
VRASIKIIGAICAVCVPLVLFITNRTEAAASAPVHTATHEWELISGKHWQIKSDGAEAPDVTDAAEGNRGSCAPGQIEVSGKMRITSDTLQQSVCSNWINRDWPERCAVFDRDKWLKITASLPTREMHFCIDRYEYPNKKGAYPMILVDWNEAGAICQKEGRRLCTEDEWTFACEGEEAMPYPYGYVRDGDACVVDKRWRLWHGAWARGRGGQAAMLELDELWQGVASGSRPKCKSPFGVYDMTGNVDEWTRSTEKTGNPSIMKGGYWGPVRTRCKPTTRIHGPQHVLYQQGMRCCGEPGAAAQSTSASSSTADGGTP